MVLVLGRDHNNDSNRKTMPYLNDEWFDLIFDWRCKNSTQFKSEERKSMSRSNELYNQKVHTCGTHLFCVLVKILGGCGRTAGGENQKHIFHLFQTILRHFQRRNLVPLFLPSIENKLQELLRKKCKKTNKQCHHLGA